MEQKNKNKQVRNRKVSSFTLNDEVKEMIIKMAKEKCISRSAVVSMAIAEFYNRENKGE